MKRADKAEALIKSAIYTAGITAAAFIGTLTIKAIALGVLSCIK